MTTGSDNRDAIIASLFVYHPAITTSGMKPIITLLLFATLLSFTSCQKNADDHDHSHDVPEGSEQSPNQALYQEVMDVHNEVMPKMNDLHKAKTSLRERLNGPGIGASEREEIERKIAQIDSASESMMVWMRQFNPVSDSAGEDKARAYLEAELVKVKEVRQRILDALKTNDPVQ